MTNLFAAKPNRKLVFSAKIVHLCSSAFFFISGLLFLFIPFEGVAPYYIVGILNIVIGVAGIYGYFSNDMFRLAFQSDFALGIFNVVLGGLLVFDPAAHDLAMLLPCAVCVISLLDGGNKCQISIEGFRFGLSKWFLVLISGLAEIGVGTAMIVLASVQADPTVLRIWLGGTLALLGAVNFWTTMYMVRIRAKLDHRETEEAMPEHKEQNHKTEGN